MIYLIRATSYKSHVVIAKRDIFTACRLQRIAISLQLKYLYISVCVVKQKLNIYTLHLRVKYLHFTHFCLCAFIAMNLCH